MNTIYIAENIRKYRASLNLTQESIAERVGVSAQAVSKWERGESLPDTAIILPLAAILGVTPNDIFGYDKAEIDAQIQIRLDEYFKLKSIGRNIEAFALIKQAHADYPNDYKIMCRYVDFLGYEPKPEYLGNADSWRANRDEIITLANRVITESSDADMRFECAVSLAACYSANENIKMAEEVCKQFPLSNFYTRPNILAYFVYENDDPRQHALMRELYHDSVGDCIWRARQRAEYGGLNDDEAIDVFKVALTIADAVFSDGDYGFVSWDLSLISCLLAKKFIQKNDCITALHYIRRSMEFARYYDSRREKGEDIILTSPLVRGYVWKVNDVTVSSNNDSELIKNHVAQNITSIEQTGTTDTEILAVLDEYRQYAGVLS